MKNKSQKNLKAIDVRFYSFLKKWLIKQRVKIYVLLFLVVLREVFLRTPYVNVIIVENIDVIDLILISVLLTTIVGLNGKKFILISVMLFLPLAVLTLLGYNVLVEKLANIIYMLILTGVTYMILNFVKQENE
jgi:hypothetical protein